MRNWSLGFPTRSGANWPVQSQMRAKSLKFGVGDVSMRPKTKVLTKQRLLHS